MPWKECHVMDERLRFVARLLDGERMTTLCEEFGISRKTGYKIYDRYKAFGAQGLNDRSRRPLRHANQLPMVIERQIVQLKKRVRRKDVDAMIRSVSGWMAILTRPSGRLMMSALGTSSRDMVRQAQALRHRSTKPPRDQCSTRRRQSHRRVPQAPASLRPSEVLNNRAFRLGGREQVERAQSVTSLLLRDVRGVVSALRGEDPIGLADALRILVDAVPQSRIHLQVADDLPVTDPLRRKRCCGASRRAE